ncbi:MAG: phage portal protein [Actinobacteria bacterium]|nr:phage portal protein [Actinomycetota bacterium]
MGGDEGSKEQDTLNAIVGTDEFRQRCYKVAIDCSRYGDGLFFVRQNKDGRGEVSLTRPDIWFPVVSEDDIEEYTHHVLAWQTKVGEESLLKVRIHEPGTLTKREYRLSGSKIDTLVSEEVEKTGLSGFAVIPAHMLITSDRTTGIDDYTDVDSIVSEILVRCSQIAKVLDAFSSPSVQGPASALQQDPITNEWKLKVGDFFMRDSTEDPPVEYLVWDAQMEANFKFIEQAVNFLHSISEVGAVIFQDELAKLGQVTGPGMKRVMQAALSKVNRLKLFYDPALRKAIALASELGYSPSLDRFHISIDWQDGLPADETEQAQVQSTLHGAGLLSRERALRQQGLTGQTIEDELARIESEAAAQTPSFARLTQTQSSGAQ